jgi:superfamily II DNA or RNA helicase
VIQAAYNPIVGFFERGGQIEIVCSGHFQKADIGAILDGIRATPEWGSVPVAELRERGYSHLDLLSWAVVNGRVHLRVAMIKGTDQGLYHEKFGIFLDGGVPFLAFEGSANETASALRYNYERVNLYWSDSNSGRYRQEVLARQFEQLWKNGTPNLTVVPLQRAMLDGLITVEEPGLRRTEQTPEPMTRPGAASDSASEFEMDIPPESLILPDRFVLHDYQSDAIRAWFENDGKGILEMATGTGKTYTALAAATKLFHQVGGPLAIIVVAPYIHLVEQWADESRRFGLSPVCCFGPWASWHQFAEAAIYRANHGTRNLVSFAVTNATFCADRFQQLLGKIRIRTVLIADEVHNLGAPKLAAALPNRVSLRIGLSATAARWLDTDGTDRLAAYFGKVIFAFGLKEALLHDPPILVPYRYHPVLVELYDDEQEQYLELTAAIGRCLSDLDAGVISELAKMLLIKRSRLLASARQKLQLLKTAMEPFKGSLHSLVYCGDSSVEFEDPDNASPEDRFVTRQIDAITAILGHDLGMAVAQFTADTPQAERQSLLTQFAQGDLQALVAIRCLDEGVNVPSISRAFILASSTNPRQFVQRRGRLLRRAEGKSSADIFDFCVRPPKASRMMSDPAFKVGRALIQSEMRRVAEFAALAQNGPQAKLKLMPVLKEWNLLHL